MKSSEFIAIGSILSPWGIQGKLKVKSQTDFPQRFTPGARVYIDRKPLTIESAEWHGNKLVVKLNTVDRAQDAQKLSGKNIEIPQSQLHPLPKGQYYHFQLIGLAVWTTQGEQLGKITEILTAESNDNYLIHGARGEILIPAIADVIKSIDLAKGEMVIEPIEGLLPSNQKTAR